MAAEPSCGARTGASDPPKLPRALNGHQFRPAQRAAALSGSRSDRHRTHERMSASHLPIGVRTALTMTGCRAGSAARKLIARRAARCAPAHAAAERIVRLISIQGTQCEWQCQDCAKRERFSSIKVQIGVLCLECGLPRRQQPSCSHSSWGLVRGRCQRTLGPAARPRSLPPPAGCPSTWRAHSLARQEDPFTSTRCGAFPRLAGRPRWCAPRLSTARLPPRSSIKRPGAPTL